MISRCGHDPMVFGCMACIEARDHSRHLISEQDESERQLRAQDEADKRKKLKKFRAECEHVMDTVRDGQARVIGEFCLRCRQRFVRVRCSVCDQEHLKHINSRARNNLCSAACRKKHQKLQKVKT